MDCRSQIPKSINIQTDSTSRIYIQDKSKYPQKFIQGLACDKPLKLIDDYIIAGSDTIYFPNDLPLYKVIVFKGTRDTSKFELTVNRINLTTLLYNFRLWSINGRDVFGRQGKAFLGSMFFLAMEIDEDDQTGEAYGSYEYSDDESRDYWFHVRIGIDKDDRGKQRAVLNYSCKEKTKQTLNLEQCPTLRTE